jgi:Protein of unknown function DUF45
LSPRPAHQPGHLAPDLSLPGVAGDRDALPPVFGRIRAVGKGDYSDRLLEAVREARRRGLGRGHQENEHEGGGCNGNLVAHELAHLLVRHHDDRFHALLDRHRSTGSRKVELLRWQLGRRSAAAHHWQRGCVVSWLRKCRGAMGIAARPGARRPESGLCSSARRAHVDPLQHASLSFVTALQAAFRTNTGSKLSASRYSMRNGESVRSSPGLPRGGGIAERCNGVRPK